MPDAISPLVGAATPGARSLHEREPEHSPRRRRLGIALGGGGARGWAHIGVLAALARHGIEPSIVCGTSAGALVGGIYAAGNLPELEAWVSRLGRREVLTLLDFTVEGGGVIAGKRLVDMYREHVGDVPIEALGKTFVAVATDLQSGAEVWLREGSLLDAIRASISLPGVFTPVLRDGRWLVDGGLVNPVPVSACRALGADVVIAVDLHVDVGRRRKPGTTEWRTASVMAASLDVMRNRLVLDRLAHDPPDVVLRPRVQDVATLDFAAGFATVQEGYAAVEMMMPAVTAVLHDERGRCSVSAA